MSSSFYLASISAIIQASLAIIVIIKNHKKKENRIFSLLLFLFVFWCVCEAFLSYKGAVPSPLCLKIMLTPVILLLYGLNIFSAYFPTTQSDAYILKNPKNPYYFFIPAIIFLILLWTNNIYTISDWQQGGFIFKYTKTEMITKGIIIFYLILSLITLNKSMKKADTQIMARRFRYTFIAMLLPVAMGPIIIALSKYFFSDGTMYLYGMFPILGIIMSFILTYTMLKYNLMDIDLIFSKGLLYTLTSVIIAGCMELIQELIQNIFEADSTAGKILTVLVVAAVFSPIKEGLEKLINIFFGRKSFDSAQIIQKTLDKLRDQQNTEELLNCFNSELQYICGAEKIDFIKAGSIPEKELTNISNDINDIDAIIFNYSEKGDNENEIKANKLKSEDIRLYYTFEVSKKHYGNILISSKKAKVPYTESEINLIKSLINELPHIIENIEMIQTILKQQKSAQQTLIARNMLNDIATKPGIDEVNNLRVASFTSLASDIKGDMLDICKDPVNTYISIYDAFHSGIKAVLTLNIIYTVFRSVTTMIAKIRRSSEILSTFTDQNLNYAFTTIQTNDKEIKIVNFGNPNPILITKECIKRLEMEPRKQIGIETKLESNEIKINLSKNEFLLCFTSGLEQIFKETLNISIDEFLSKNSFISEIDCKNKITNAINSKISEGFSEDTSFIVVGLK